jgi:hypothetical protein
MAEITDLTTEILKGIQTELGGLRRDVRDVQEGYLGLLQLLQRIDGRHSQFEQRLADMKADLETMFKMEIIGQFAHLETRLENTLSGSLAPIATRLQQIEAKLDIH